MTVRISLLLMTLLGLACRSKEEAVFNDSGAANESKPLSRSANAVSVASDVTQAIAATYEMNVITRLGVSMCKGEAKLIINSDFTLDIPAAAVICLSMRVDLQGLLKGSEALKKLAATSRVSSDGQVLSVDRVGPGVFAPPRPLLLGPIVQDVRSFVGLERVSEHTLTFSDPTMPPLSGRGTIAIKVLAVGETYNSPGLAEPFTNVMRWELSSAGFEGLPIGKAGLFERIEYSWNTRPLMVPKLTISGRLKDYLIGTSIIGAFADALLGTVTVELTVKEYSRY